MPIVVENIEVLSIQAKLRDDTLVNLSTGSSGVVQYVLDKNWNDLHSLHGGKDGISFKNFDYEIKENKEYVDVIFKYLELENLLPGDVNYKITYRISFLKNEFTIFFNAISNKDTLINLTNHAYFNLSGNIKKTILDHKLKLNCDYYTDLDETLITKEIKPVDKIMDFRRFKKIGKDIFNPQIHDAAYKGYDHCFIRQNKSKNNDVIAILKDPLSKRKLTVKTSYPSIVCYTCNYPANITINGNKINQHQSICLECQYIPNGINMENVNKAIFKANEIYEEYITYQFDN